ncbi:MAG: response regulator [bacterium]
MNGAKTGKKILVVDDESDVVTYLSTLFQENGYDTVSAADGNEAMEKLKTEKPDLISLDISLPKKSGVKFYREIKGDPDTRNVPVVIVTAITGYGDDREAFKRFISTRRQVPPPEGFILKPIDTKELLETVRRLLSGG